MLSFSIDVNFKVQPFCQAGDYQQNKGHHPIEVCGSFLGLSSIVYTYCSIVLVLRPELVAASPSSVVQMSTSHSAPSPLSTLDQTEPFGLQLLTHFFVSSYHLDVLFVEPLKSIALQLCQHGAALSTSCLQSLFQTLSFVLKKCVFLMYMSV